MTDLSQKTLILNGYTFKDPRSISVAAPEDRMTLSDKSIYGKRRVKKSPDPNLTITVTVPTGTEDETVLLNAAEYMTVSGGYFKDSSVDKYKRGITLGEVGVNKGELTNDGEADSREFTLVCADVREVLI